MCPTTPQPRQMGAAFAMALVLMTGAVSVWVRWPGFTQGGFASHDVAGILYNAMLLHAGELPYVGSVELKPPGTFYLAAMLAGDSGTDIARFQIWANLWALASWLSVTVIAWRTWGPRAAVVAAGLCALHDAHLDTMDANYVTWAQLPMVLAIGWALEALRTEHRRLELPQFVVAGVLAGAAVQFKQPAGIAVLMVLGMASVPWSLRADVRRLPTRRVRSLVAAGGGIVLAHLPVALHYAHAGKLHAWVDGYVLNRWGFAYASHGARSLAEHAAWEGPMAAAFFLALPLALAAFAVWPPREPVARRITVFLVSWMALAAVAASIGFRFYKGYFLAMLPPACLLAAAPWGLFGSARGASMWARGLGLIVAGGLATRAGIQLVHERDNRALAHDQGGRIIANHIRAHIPHGERIWVWGWHLWDVYPFTGRLAGTRLYKTMGLTTPPNDDTWRRAQSPMRFVDGPAAQTLVRELDRNRPYFIVLGSSVPVAEFTALNAFLRRHYRRDYRVRLNRVQFWERRERRTP